MIVGPNGTGKSAVLDTIALRFLAYFYHQSALDWNYVNTMGDQAAWWGGRGHWRREYTWLPGLHCTTDQAPILYDRPGHLPGNETSVAAAMMTGYFDDARRYAEMTDQKSSGEQRRALLARVLRALQGDASALPTDYVRVNWRARIPQRQGGRQEFPSEIDLVGEALQAMTRPEPQAVPLLVLDEPEQSLDALTEIALWRSIERCDTARMQVIVATHSLYPILHPSKFNIIEAEDGYAKSVRVLARPLTVEL